MEWKGKERIEKTPGILIIDSDFDKFNPRNNHWLHICLRNSMSQDGDVSIFELEELFSALAGASKSGKNIFSSFDEIIKNKKKKVLYDAFEFKPQMLGISFDIKKGIEFFCIFFIKHHE